MSCSHLCVPPVIFLFFFFLPQSFALLPVLPLCLSVCWSVGVSVRLSVSLFLSVCVGLSVYCLSVSPSFFHLPLSFHLFYLLPVQFLFHHLRLLSFFPSFLSGVPSGAACVLPGRYLVAAGAQVSRHVKVFLLFPVAWEVPRGGYGCGRRGTGKGRRRQGKGMKEQGTGREGVNKAEESKVRVRSA